MAVGGSNQRSKIIGVVAIVVIAAAGFMIVRSLFRGSDRDRPSSAYYTVDDGASVFVDKIERIAPFDHAGQPAVRAHVFSTDGNKTHVVGYLEKYDLDVMKQRDAAAARGESPFQYNAGPFIKKPGAQYTKWLSATDGREFVDTMVVTPPEGSTGTLVEVYP